MLESLIAEEVKNLNVSVVWENLVLSKMEEKDLFCMLSPSALPPSACPIFLKGKWLRYDDGGLGFAGAPSGTATCKPQCAKTAAISLGDRPLRGFILY